MEAQYGGRRSRGVRGKIKFLSLRPGREAPGEKRVRFTWKPILESVRRPYLAYRPARQSCRHASVLFAGSARRLPTYGASSAVPLRTRVGTRVAALLFACPNFSNVLRRTNVGESLCRSIPVRFRKRNKLAAVPNGKRVVGEESCALAASRLCVDEHSVNSVRLDFSLHHRPRVRPVSYAELHAFSIVPSTRLSRLSARSAARSFQLRAASEDTMTRESASTDDRFQPLPPVAAARMSSRECSSTPCAMNTAATSSRSLASRIRSFSHPMGSDPATLRAIEAWQAEWKWDGIRLPCFPHHRWRAAKTLRLMACSFLQGAARWRSPPLRPHAQAF